MAIEFIIVAVFLIFFFLQWGVEDVLEILNIRHLRSKAGEIPELMADIIDPETQQKSEAYTLEKSRYGLIQGAFGNILTLAILFSGILPWWQGHLQSWGLQSFHLSVAYVVGVGIFSAILSMPFGLYFTFVIEKKYGFNKMTFRLWIMDLLKSTVIGAAIGLPILYAVFWFIKASGAFWWIWVVAFLTIIQLLMVYIYPTLIAPLFNKFEVLAEGDLKDGIQQLVTRIGFTTAGVFKMDGSKRSGHSNAYFTGFGRSKRIVLFDTLIEKITTAEILAVLGHELGHFKLKHIFKMLLISILSSLAGFYVLSLLIDWVPFYRAFGFTEPSHAVALQLFVMCSGAFTFFVPPFMNRLSRKHEYEADTFAVENAGDPDALKTALIKLNKENLSNLHPHPWYSGWHYSHPTILERLESIERLKQ
jgi:STE24 endopeptidase